METLKEQILSLISSRLGVYKAEKLKPHIEEIFKNYEGREEG